MTIQERFRYETFLRIKQFGIDNAVDFPPNSVGEKHFAELNAVISNIEQASANQVGGKNISRQHFTSKDSVREDLRELLSDIARTARSMTYEIKGIDDTFRLPRNRNDQNMLAIARNFLTEVVPVEAKFIEYEMPEDFLADLQSKIEAFEQSVSNSNSAIGSQVSATADIGEIIKRGMVIRKVLDGVVKNKYRNDVARLAAWTSASYIEKNVKKKSEEKPVS